MPNETRRRAQPPMPVSLFTYTIRMTVDTDLASEDASVRKKGVAFLQQGRELGQGIALSIPKAGARHLHP